MRYIADKDILKGHRKFAKIRQMNKSYINHLSHEWLFHWQVAGKKIIIFSCEWYSFALAVFISRTPWCYCEVFAYFSQKNCTCVKEAVCSLTQVIASIGCEVRANCI